MLVLPAWPACHMLHPRTSSALPAPRWEASQKAIRNVDFSAAHADGVLISCDEAGACRLWVADNGELIAELQSPPGVPFMHVHVVCFAYLWAGGGGKLIVELQVPRVGWMRPWRAGAPCTLLGADGYQLCLLACFQPAELPQGLLPLLHPPCCPPPSCHEPIATSASLLLQTCRGPPSSAAAHAGRRRGAASCCSRP